MNSAFQAPVKAIVVSPQKVPKVSKVKELKSYPFIASGACSYKNYLNDACHVGATFGCDSRV
jgi:hypothetical protein